MENLARRHFNAAFFLSRLEVESVQYLALVKLLSFNQLANLLRNLFSFDKLGILCKSIRLISADQI